MGSVLKAEVAVQQFFVPQGGGEELLRARGVLYQIAQRDLCEQGQFSGKRGKEFLKSLLEQWPADCACERCRVPRLEADSNLPACEVRGELLLRPPQTDQLGAYGLWLVLAAEAGAFGLQRELYMVLPDDAKVTPHHLAWLSCVDAALGGSRVHLLANTWTHDCWRHGFGREEGFPLADMAPVVLQHLMDVETGEHLSLRLSRTGSTADGRASYEIALVPSVKAYDSEPRLADIRCVWSPEAGDLTYGAGGDIEDLQVDCSAGCLVAKFFGQFNLRYYDTWQQSWVLPQSVALFGESAYDRAYYLGQGCWEDMERLQPELARMVVEHGWFGDAKLSSSLVVTGPDGAGRVMDPRALTYAGTIQPPYQAFDSITPIGAQKPAAPSPAWPQQLVDMFNQTRAAIHAGGYETGGWQVRIPGSVDDWHAVRVFSQDELVRMVEHPSYRVHARTDRHCVVEVVRRDSFAAAAELAYDTRGHAGGQQDRKPPLVLNFANPIEPGGGVLRGARAQEEDLCRCSTLYVSLGSKEARPYYQQNMRAHQGLFSHNALLSPHVQVFRASDGAFLERPFEVAVLTVAAPYVPNTVDVPSYELEAVLATRIMGMLHIAASCGYHRLVLGAWGCGAFGNDPEQVADVFRRALLTFHVDVGGDPMDNPRLDKVFNQIRFAVPGEGRNNQVFTRVLDGLDLV